MGRAAGGWAQLRRAAALLLPLAFLACSGTKRPVLYPNALYEEVGEAAAQEDVTHCIEVARAHDLSDERTAGDAARGATRGSLIGAAVGAAMGWVLGNPGRGAAAGAAGGGHARSREGRHALGRRRQRLPALRRDLPARNRLPANRLALSRRGAVGRVPIRG